MTLLSALPWGMVCLNTADHRRSPVLSGYSGHVKQGGGSPDEARLEETPYPFHVQLIWRYLGIK